MNGFLSRLPYRGAGIGLREEIANETAARRNKIDVLEIISDRFIGGSRRKAEFLEKFSETFPVIPHGVDLSIGSVAELDFKYLQKIKDLCEKIGADYYSEHFAVTRLPEVNIGHLSPVWFTRKSLEIVVQKTSAIQEFLGLPLVLENITSHFDIPEADFEEPEFIREVARRTGCGLLLDLANVHINSHNRKRDPYEFLKRLPLESVVQIHLAGGRITGEWFHDTHSEEINGANEGVWPLLEWTTERSPNLKAVIIERDENFKSGFDEILSEDLSRARRILNRARTA